MAHSASAFNDRPFLMLVFQLSHTPHFDMIISRREEREIERKREREVKLATCLHKTEGFLLALLKDVWRVLISNVLRSKVELLLSCANTCVDKRCSGARVNQ